jgi:hypothetical protein
VVPQLRRGENSLYLWNHGNCLQPVHQFVGHQDVILEFEWRKQKEGKKKSYTVISHFIRFIKGSMLTGFIVLVRS